MRELRPELQLLIDSGHCNWHSTIDMTLSDSNQLWLSTGEIHVNRFGKNQQYLAWLSDVQALELSLDPETDGLTFKVSNVNMTMGRMLTTATRTLDGAEAIYGVLFLEKGQPVSTAIWDAKIPGELMAADVTDESVEFSFVSSIDSVIVSGRTIAEEFQWREPTTNVPLIDPNDNPGGPTITPGVPYSPTRGGKRYLDPIPWNELP